MPYTLWALDLHIVNWFWLSEIIQLGMIRKTHKSHGIKKKRRRNLWIYCPYYRIIINRLLRYGEVGYSAQFQLIHWNKILSRKGITWQNDCYFPSHLREIEKTCTAGGHSLGPNLKLTSYNQSISVYMFDYVSYIVVPWDVPYTHKIWNENLCWRQNNVVYLLTEIGI